MDILTMIINIFLAPTVAVGGCYRRGLMGNSIPILLQYGAITMQLYCALVIELWLVEFLLSQAWFIGGEKATMLAFFQALAYPFVREFVCKYIHVSVKMSERGKDEN